MKIYETKLQYSLVKESAVSKPLDMTARAYEYMQGAFDNNPMQESLWVISLTRKLHPISRTMVSLGSINSSVASPPDIFRVAILANAAAIIVAHNHPSGDPLPSRADIQITKKLAECGSFMNIDLIDHIVCGDPKMDPKKLGFYSFRENGLI